MSLDIIIPLYNKDKNILNCYNKINDEIKNIKHNFIFVDDASTDKTLEILKSIQANNDENVKIINLSKSYGKDVCIYAGLEHSKSNLVCIYDLDLLSSVTHITKMYEFLQSHDNYDSVCMYSNYEEKNFLKKLKIKLLNKLFSLDINVNKTNYRMMRRNVVNAILKNQNKRFSLYLFELIGFNTYYMKFENKNHLNNLDIKKMIVYSNKPFKFIKYFNLLLTIIFITILILCSIKLLKIGNNILFLSILLITIIENYIIRFTSCYINKKQQKIEYFIREKVGFDDNIL